jgi:hypothetical protein
VTDGKMAAVLAGGMLAAWLNVQTLMLLVGRWHFNS